MEQPQHYEALGSLLMHIFGRGENAFRVYFAAYLSCTLLLLSFCISAAYLHTHILDLTRLPTWPTITHPDRTPAEFELKRTT